MKNNNNNNNKDYSNYIDSPSANNYPPMPASYVQNNNNNNNLHPLDELNKFNSKPIAQSQFPNQTNFEKPFQAGNMPNNNNNLDRPYQAGNMPNPNNNNNIPRQGNIQFQTPNQIPLQQQQIPVQQQIPGQPQVVYMNPQPVYINQPQFIPVQNRGVCPYCAGSGISLQTGFRCNCVGGMTNGDMLALGLGLGLMRPYYGYRPFYY